MRILRFILLGLLLVVVVIAVGGFILFNDLTRGPLPQHSGTLKVAGLQAPVEIIRDDYGVPHIYAANAHDLLFAQGYTQAQDRWWQMEFSRAIGSGRIQELTGQNDDVMGNDVFIRTAGWRAAAERNIAEAYDAETLAYLQAFADGVNAYIGGKNGGDLALEYSLLGVNGVTIPIQPWTPVDSEAWIKAMQWNLGTGLQDQDRSYAYEALSDEEFDVLEPQYPFDRHPTIVTEDDLPIWEKVPLAAAPADRVVAAHPARPVETAFAGGINGEVAFGFGMGAGLGSNNWVVHGSKTATGMPLLANDPHLGIQMPSIWYEIGLHCQPVSEACPFDMRGYSFPAAPGIVLGHNNRIAWGFTNIDPDVIDLYEIKVNPDNPLQYEFDGEMRDMTVRNEEIKFGDGGSVTIQVRETHLGPIITDNVEVTPEGSSGYGEVALAMRWTALDPAAIYRALFGLNKAQNFEDFRAAAGEFVAPAQNIVYADVDGNIGYQTPGLIPIRPAVNTGLVIQDGSTSATEWLGYVPADLLPRIYNPERGWIHSANEALAPLEYYDQLKAQLAPEYGDDINVVFNRYWDFGFRGERIVELLEASDQHTIESLQAIQMDNKILVAEAMAPYLATLQFDDADLAAARDWMLEWDFQANRDSGPAALFSALWRRIPAAVFNDSYGDRWSVGGGSAGQYALIGLLDQPDNALWDDLSTDGVEDRDALLAALFADAHAELVETLGADRSQWEWGKLHAAVFVSNPLGQSGISLIEDIVNRSTATGGWTGAVDATNWSTGSDTYDVGSLPSMRTIYDLGDLDRSVNHHTTGQSGHPYSADYDNQIPLWASGTYKPMVFTRAAVEAAARDTLRLEPAN
ncbi:MAG: penicillin acylase family protein [Chloroflexi bacterium]|nr:penicillin acylase family protein [Chloroflexota bacterium]MBV6436336.1 Acyl-homoserine lactone acylase QuiP [Anaerolineae bacterium]MDL1914979.1 penicillin acylase family protein [Anaerolineae bacterium CFX4]